MEQEDDERKVPKDKEKEEVEMQKNTEEEEEDKSWEDRQDERRLRLGKVCTQHEGETNMKLNVKRLMG